MFDVKTIVNTAIGVALGMFLLKLIEKTGIVKSFTQEEI